MAQLPTQSMRLVNRYAILEPDGVTVVEMADDEDSAMMAAPKPGRMIQRDGVTRYVAANGAWCWMPGGA